jgi:hypothetical protein
MQCLSKTLRGRRIFLSSLYLMPAPLDLRTTKTIRITLAPLGLLMLPSRLMAPRRMLAPAPVRVKALMLMRLHRLPLFLM